MSRLLNKWRISWDNWVGEKYEISGNDWVVVEVGGDVRLWDVDVSGTKVLEIMAEATLVSISKGLIRIRSASVIWCELVGIEKNWIWSKQ